MLYLTSKLNVFILRTKPLNYIAWLLGHESRGSVLAWLKEKYETCILFQLKFTFLI